MIEIITAPTVEPITLAQARLHLRIDDDNTADDSLITSLIIAARQSCEKYTGRALITQTAKQYSKACFPVMLDLNAVQSITSVTVIDSDELETVLDPSEYRLGKNLIRFGVYLTSAYTSMVTLSRDVVIEFIAGYGDAASDVPEPLKQWMLLLIGAMYENREAVTPVNLLEMPVYKALAAPYIISSGF